MTREEEALRIDVFWEALKRYSLELVREAFEDAYRNLKWFPRPAEIIEIIEVLKPRERQEPTKEQIEWQEPTEEGRAIAKKMLQDVMNRIDEKIAEEERQRAERWIKNREALKKQVKMIRKEAK